ncbi:DNA polymerase III subunit gamma/tau [Rheinheimera aquimaris]|jgi:DNA polymerase-3 subunit gamma/tau|uniref:DNA polymerase III subunit gamma/tau n=1 Tax=Rheinheimera aquimaris TaxID=412437 RepID=UPI00106562E9|nr:DNA polymerase III subunit gamma/tau [Rheinheimera aquimaris]
MSYQVLARKWRPQHFAQLVGQEHVKNALSNALNNNRLHHAYLFTGTRGVGKTTIARIFAKSLNCEQGISATPCGQCSACVEIDAGNFVDLMEIDAASRTKVEDTRDLLDNVQYAPSRGRFKVYLIDEVHMLSKHSFNALLKTLEEPPPHVKFLLATTDPQKLPITVLSRCLQFNLLALSPQQIEQHLAYVLEQEHIPFEAAALTMLARAAKGSLRDSLSLTDQAIAQSNADITVETTRNMLGFLDQSWAQLLLQAVIAQDAAQLQIQLAALVQQHSHFSQVLDDMLALLHLTALSQFSQSAAAFSAQQDYVMQLAEKLAPAQVQLYYQLLISGKKELPYAPDPLTGLEMALLRAMAFTPETQQKVAHSAAKVPVAPAEVALQSAAEAAVKTAHSENTHTPASESPANSSTSAAVAQSVQAEAKPENVEGIDPVTARIMARRGVQITAASPAKKSERQQALTDATNISQATAVTAGLQETVTQAKEAQYAAAPAPAPAPAPEIPALAKPQTVEVVPTALSTPSYDQDSYPADDVDMPEYDMAATDGLWQQYEQEMQYGADTSHQVQLEQFDGSINEQNFSVRHAAQVDAWAARVETLDTGGLSRLFLLNAAMQLSGNVLNLTVAQSQQHLDSTAFRTKLQQVLQQSFNQPLEINISYQPEVPDSPLSIQQKIVQERLVYVSRLLQQDEKVLQLQQMFDAQVLTDTITVN